MSPIRTFATAGRVLKQLRHDRRALLLLFVVPPVLLGILKNVYQQTPETYNIIAPMILGIFPMVMMFLITSITTMRERTSGTLERLLATNITKLDFILGYAIAFSTLALLQAIVASVVLLGPLEVAVRGGAIPVLVSAVFSGFLGTSLGLFVSAFASSEFQAAQFMPTFLFPQFLTCGLLVPREKMSTALQHLSDFMPLTYSVEAMQQVATQTHWTTDLTKNLIIIACFGIGSLLLGTMTIRRQERT